MQGHACYGRICHQWLLEEQEVLLPWGQHASKKGNSRVSASAANGAAIDDHEEQGTMSFHWTKAECTCRVQKAAAGEIAGAGHAARMQCLLAQ